MLKVALLGSGKWGKNYVNAVSESKLGRITSVFTSETVCQLAKVGPKTLFAPQSDIAYLAEIVAEELARLKVEAAVVATHPPWTETLTLSVLARGISVMAEKPFSFSCKPLDLIDKLTAQGTIGPIFLINHQHLFSDAVSYMSDRLEQAQIRRIITKAGGFGPFRDYPSMWDYGPHDLSLTSFLTKSRLELIEYRKRTFKDGHREWIAVTSGCNTYALLSTWNNRAPKVHRVSVKGKVDNKAVELIYDDFDARGRLWINGDFPVIPYTPPLTKAVQHFLSKVIDRNPYSDLRFGTYLARQYTHLLDRTSEKWLGKTGQVR
jgi:predicted dehydrogenase